MLRIQMITMRLKAGPAVSSEWRCLFCLHVRTATIILGIWHLILHVLALTFLAVIIRNHVYLHEQGFSINENGVLSNDLSNADIDHNGLEGLPTPLSKIELESQIPRDTIRDHSLFYPDLDIGAFVTLITMSITVLLVYGAVKGKPTHLLPFFCLQLFDFAISTLTATGYACYMRSMRRLVAETWHLPFRSVLLQLSPQCLSLVVLLAFIISMIIKAYCIGIVWRCYKYLTLRQQALRSAIHYIMPTDITDRPVEPDYSSLLPNYEQACKMAPPPSYTVAVATDQIVAHPSIETPVEVPVIRSETPVAGTSSVPDNVVAESAEVVAVVQNENESKTPILVA